MISNDRIINFLQGKLIIKSTVCRVFVGSVNRDCNILSEQNIVPILLAAFSARFLEKAAVNRAYMIADDITFDLSFAIVFDHMET